MPRAGAWSRHRELEQVSIKRDRKALQLALSGRIPIDQPTLAERKALYRADIQTPMSRRLPPLRLKPLMRVERVGWRGSPASR